MSDLRLWLVKAPRALGVVISRKRGEETEEIRIRARKEVSYTVRIIRTVLYGPYVYTDLMRICIGDSLLRGGHEPRIRTVYRSVSG